MIYVKKTQRLPRFHVSIIYEKGMLCCTYVIINDGIIKEKSHYYQERFP